MGIENPHTNRPEVHFRDVAISTLATLGTCLASAAEEPAATLVTAAVATIFWGKFAINAIQASRFPES